MEQYKQRVIEEKVKLIDKLQSLIDFMHTDLYVELSPVEQGLLMVQEVAMASYLGALERRTELF